MRQARRLDPVRTAEAAARSREALSFAQRFLEAVPGFVGTLADVHRGVGIALDAGTAVADITPADELEQVLPMYLRRYAHHRGLRCNDPSARELRVLEWLANDASFIAALINNRLKE